MRTGNLRRTVTVQRRSTDKDAAGQQLDAWTSLVTRRASIEPLNGREYLTASGEHSDVKVRIRMRYDQTTAAIKQYDRIIDAAESPQVEYDIEDRINVRERGKELVFMCRRL